MKEFDHEEEVIKARHMPHENANGLVASMTNSGKINLYNLPEISENLTPSKGQEV